MKKCALAVVLMIFLVSCSNRHTPSTSPFSPRAYTNSGRIKTTDATNDVLSTTTDGTYYYDSTGKIYRIDTAIISLPAESIYYQYTAAGKVSLVTGSLYNVGQSGSQSYGYDASGRLNMISYDWAVATGVVDTQTFGYGADGFADTVNEIQNGMQACYRMITRDINGYILREDIYPDVSTTTEFAYAIFTRGAGSVTEDIFFGAVKKMEIIAVYDSNGFISRLEYSGTGAQALFTQNFQPQSGPFDPAGLRGYYYTDTDLFGLAHEAVNSTGAGL